RLRHPQLGGRLQDVAVTAPGNFARPRFRRNHLRHERGARGRVSGRPVPARAQRLPPHLRVHARAHRGRARPTHHRIITRRSRPIMPAGPPPPPPARSPPPPPPPPRPPASPPPPAR